jgi:hypothetical protein
MKAETLGVGRPSAGDKRYSQGGRVPAGGAFTPKITKKPVQESNEVIGPRNPPVGPKDRIPPEDDVQIEQDSGVQPETGPDEHALWQENLALELVREVAINEPIAGLKTLFGPTWTAE